jgi:glycosyltransferase involved in cell wall biosynthesis
MSPSISVVIPYFNGSRFVGEALESVRAQTLAPLEVIVVDDGSRPEEADVLDREARDCLVVHLPRNRGVSVARNVGIARARGDWIAFLDCDDLWDPRKLEVQMGLVRTNPDCRAIHCGIRNARLDGTVEVHPKGEVSFEDFLVFPCPIFPSATLMERNSLLECGLFDPTMAVCQDLDLFMRFARCIGRFYCAPEVMVTRRVQAEGLSRNTAAFWSEAHRVYRDFLPSFQDERRGLEALREVHTDMALRALYAGDMGLLRRIVHRATQSDMPFLLLAGRTLARALRARMQR